MEMSKLEDYITFSLANCTNLSKMWASGDYYQRQELQNALFTEGIVYDRQKDDCRSTSDNYFITEAALLSKDLGSFSENNNQHFDSGLLRAHRAESKCLPGFFQVRITEMKFQIFPAYSEMEERLQLSQNGLRAFYHIPDLYVQPGTGREKQVNP
jgi:hypothetical protein